MDREEVSKRSQALLEQQICPHCLWGRQQCGGGPITDGGAWGLCPKCEAIEFDEEDKS